MGMFDLSTLTETANSSNNNLSLKTVEENYYYTAMAYVTETNKEYNFYKKELYKNLLESTSVEIINESFQDFFDKVHNLISKFIDFIKSLFKRFIINFNKMTSSDKYVKKHINELDNFTKDNEFIFKGYKFTFDPDIPIVEALREFSKDFVGIDFEELMQKRDVKEQIKYINKVFSKVSTYDYDEFRGEVIDKNYFITSSEFSNELFSLYRAGSNSSYPITIGVDELARTVQNFNEYEKYIASVKQTKSKIESQYKEIEKLFKKIIGRNEMGDLEGLLIDGSGNYDDNRTNINKLSTEVINKVNLYIKVKIEQIKKMSDIHSLAFASKLEALKQSYKQDKSILYKALSEVEKESYKNPNVENESVSKLDLTIFNNNLTLDDYDLQRFINEINLIGNSDNYIENIDVLNEALADGVKNAILKLVNVIATIWKKFIESANTLIKGDKAYLDKYKDIILKKELTEATYKMYDYPTALKSVLNNATVPQFNYQAMKDYLTSDAAFIKQYFGNFAQKYDENDEANKNFKAVLMAKFRGSEKEIDFTANDLKMVDLFNFCYNFDDILKNINKDTETIKAGAKAGLKLVQDTIVAESTILETYVGEYKPLQRTKQYYSVVYNKFINEAEINPTNPVKDPNVGSVKSTFVNKGSNINQTQAPEKKSGESDNAIKQNVNTAKAVPDKQQSEKQLTEIKDQINRYIALTGKFMEAKISIYNEIHKNYMQIIKYHVRTNLKNSRANDKTGNTTPDKSTQYVKGDNNSMVDNMFK